MDNNDLNQLSLFEANDDKKYVEQKQSKTDKDKFFPCTVDNYETTNIVTIESTNGLLFFDLLEEYGLYGNGYCWEGIIQQILEKEKPKLLKVTNFDSEGDTFVAYFDTKELQLEFAEFIHSICTNIPLFKSYLEIIDKDKIDA